MREEAKEGEERQEDQVAQGVTGYCPTCRQEKPIGDFVEGNVDVAYDDSPPSCKDCREKGIVLSEPAVMKTLNVIQRKVLKAIMMGKTNREAARLAGCCESQVRNLMKDHQGRHGAFRNAFQMMLEVEGLDFHSMVRMAKVLTYAREPKWNPKTEEWDWFADNKTRLGMLRQLMRVRELEPLHAGQFQVGANTVNIITNVSGDAQPKDAPGTFTIAAQPVAELSAGGEES